MNRTTAARTAQRTRADARALLLYRTRIAPMRAAGLSWARLAAALNARGVPGPRGGRWAAPNLLELAQRAQRILKRP